MARNIAVVGAGYWGKNLIRNFFQLGSLETICDARENLKLECQHFLDCIENRFTPKTDAREGLRVLRVLQASQQSLEEGKRVYLKGQKPAKTKDFYIHHN